MRLPSSRAVELAAVLGESHRLITNPGQLDLLPCFSISARLTELAT